VACGIVFVAASGATLTPSTFEGNDGNMTVDAAGHTDWASLAGNAGLRTLVDVPSGQDDNAFGQGTKEDDTSVTVVTGSIPPQKNDLTRAYVYNDRIGSSSFVYLAWERAAAIGDAHIDFELNQNATTGFDGSTVGPVTLNRTKGDLLIAYDFGGSGTPDITLFTWDGTQWSNQQDLSALGFAEAAVNTADLSDVLNNNAAVGTGEFGEASVNLSDALLAAGFNQDTCQSFGSIMVKARSSGSSTTAELKDFIAPVPFHASNCATPTVVTQTSVSSMTVGDTQTVGDTAMLTGDSPTGDVSFQLYSDAGCANPVAGVGGSATLDASGVATFSGASFTPTHAGTYYWGVSYAGDKHNNAASACGGDNEEIVVDKASPSVATELSSSAGNDGAKVHDSATLSGATADAGGTVTYSVFSDSSCTHQFADGGTVAVSNGSVPDSNVVTFDKPGTYYWQASYSGDANNKAAMSACTDEQLVISPLIDLAVTKVGSPNPVELGHDITWTMVVTNNGPDTATGVTIVDPMPGGNTFVSASPSQGSCTGGAILHCSLGTIAAGGTVRITLVTTPGTVGKVTNTVTVSGNETETNLSNNTASASVVVNQITPPPKVFCVAVSRVTPKQLFVGRSTKLTIHVTRHGQAVKGVRVRIKGAKMDIRTKPSNAKGVIKRVVKVKKAGILIFSPIAGKRCNTKRVGVTGVFTPPVTG
jgi:uncharacterized repeat protein (TIGR01451 family)